VKPYVIAIGSTAVDEYYECSSWPVLGDKAFVRFAGKKLGGMISNAACVMGNYDISVYLLDVLGGDEDTGMILSELERFGVKTDLIETRQTLRNTKAMIFLCGGERSILIVENHKPYKPLTDSQISMMNAASILYSSINDFKSLPGHEQWLDPNRMDSSPLLVYDVEPNSYQDADTDIYYFLAADYLLFNEAGFRKWQGKDAFETAVNRLFAGRSRSIVITLAEKGCRLITRASDRIFPGVSVTAVDTTGAGDTFNATWITALIKGMTEDDACRLANGAAARSTLTLGARSGAVPWETVLRSSQTS
jgi:ribokinase